MTKDPKIQKALLLAAGLLNPNDFKDEEDTEFENWGNTFQTLEDLDLRETD